ncbi:MAG: ABC transporter ATP-binding protein [Desulfobacteraceae bacterium]|nr:MAG: ABC transporter ATP-binding protein [Desulfobacteraceae bacterium]
MIRLEGISKIYNRGKSNEFSALRNIDLDIAEQGITAFVGPSGSGKTTLLSIIGCMCRPTSGRIRLNGREVTSLPERFAAETRRKTFGFIFQNYNLIRGLSVLENTMLPAYPTGVRHQCLKDRAMALLRKLKLDGKAGQKIELLSGGEQQRSAIARALINEPSVVVADEPTAHLDTELAEALLVLMAGLKQEGKTILIASHDPLVFQSSIVDRVVRMRDGMVV